MRGRPEENCGPDPVSVKVRRIGKEWGLVMKMMRLSKRCVLVCFEDLYRERFDLLNACNIFLSLG